MGVSRRVLVAVSALAVVLAACDVLVGLNQYTNVECAFDCGVVLRPDASDSGLDALGALDVGSDVTLDVGPHADALADADGSADGDADADADAYADSSVPEGGFPVPSANEIWAFWPMPNPDASNGNPFDAASLPNQMGYDAGIDGASTVAFDLRTGLSWSRADFPATSLNDAWAQCGQGWRVPTRIELISIVDFTRQPETIDITTFPDASAAWYWTASPVGGQSAQPGAYWTVSFANGLASLGNPATLVRCVKGGADAGP